MIEVTQERIYEIGKANGSDISLLSTFLEEISNFDYDVRLVTGGSNVHDFWYRVDIFTEAQRPNSKAWECHGEMLEELIRGKYYYELSLGYYENAIDHTIAIQEYEHKIRVGHGLREHFRLHTYGTIEEMIEWYGDLQLIKERAKYLNYKLLNR